MTCCDCRRTFPLDRFHQFPEHPPEHADVTEHVEQSDDSQLAGVVKDAHPFCRQEVAAQAEHLQAGTERFQFPDDTGGVHADL